MKLRPRVLTVVFVLGLVLAGILTIVFHKSGGPGSAVARQSPRPSASAHANGPATVVPSEPATAGPPDAGGGMTVRAQAEVLKLVNTFVTVAFSMSWQDAPGAIAQRTAPYVTADFTGQLPQLPTKTSNYGRAFYQHDTVCVADVNTPSDIQFNGASMSRAQLKVMVTLTTSYSGSGTNVQTVPIVVTVVHTTRRGWLVSSLIYEGG